MAQTKTFKAARFLALGLLLLGSAVRAEDLEPALDDNDAPLTAQALRQNNNNPITARRRALRDNVANLLQTIPGTLITLINDMPQAEKDKMGIEPLKELKTAYVFNYEELWEMKEKVSKPMYGSTLDKLEDRYPKLRDEILSKIYQVTAYRFFNDQERFKVYAQKQMDIAVAIRDREKDRRTSAKQVQTLRHWQGEIGSFPSAERLDQIYDNLDARQVDDKQVIITQGSKKGTTASAAVLGVQLSEFKPQPKVTKSAPVPSPIQANVPRAIQPNLAAQPRTTTPTTVDTNVEELSGTRFSAFMKNNLPTRKSAQAVFTKVVNAVEKWSDKYDINPLLVMSFMGQESLFVGWERAVTVVSNKGAGGLMQLMPDTARGLGVRDRWSIDQNIMGGAKYIKDQRASFSNKAEFDKLDTIMLWGAEQVVKGGRNANQVWNEVWNMVPMGVKNSIAAYNCGPGRIWQFGGYNNLPKWLHETKAYVPGVLSRYFQHAVDYVRRGGPEGVLTTASLAPKPNA